MRFFGLDEPERMPSDCRVAYFYQPTYVGAAIIMQAMLQFPGILDQLKQGSREIISGVLYGCTGRHFEGAGYEAFRRRLDVMNLFLDARVIDFTEQYQELCPEFCLHVYLCMDGIKKLYLEGPVIADWDQNYTEEVKELLMKAEMLDEGDVPARYYLAYGSNLNKQIMQSRCPEAELVGTTELRDWRLCFKKSQTGFYLTIEKAKGHTVPAAVWKVNQDDEATLDRYEGYPRQYQKEELRVDVKKAGERWTSPYKVFVYRLPEDRPFGWPTSDYMHICRDGYQDFRFNEELLWEALRYSDKMA